MKKNLSILSLLFGLFVCVTVFSACSKDDDKGSSSSSNPIVGTWWIENESKGYKYYTELTYNADYTCTYLRYRYEGDNKNLIDTKTGTYAIDGNKLSILYKGSDKPWSTTFTVSGNTMTTTEAGGSTWTKK